MKRKIEEIKKDSKEDVKNLLLHLESEYRKASISEKQYKELKEKYNKMLKGIPRKEVAKEELTETPEETIEAEAPEEEEEAEEETEEEIPIENENIEEKPVEKKGFLKSIFGKKKETGPIEQKNQNIEQLPVDDPPPKKSKEKEEEITEMTPEVIEKLAQKAKEQAEGVTEGTKEESKEKKSGFLKSLFGKKEEVKVTLEPENRPETQNENNIESSVTEKYKPAGADYSVEIEKLKVMIDAVRESGKVTDETARGLSESIGEIRSMVFQADAELKEVSLKMERIEDEISDVKPQEIQKKFRESSEFFEKHQLELEKLSKKAEDSGEKINKVFEMLKAIGGIENLINVNKQVQEKLENVNEAMKYIERIGTKTEKMFIDINRGLQDLIVIRARQDDFNESLKDIIKNIDSLNVKFEGYVTKKDLDAFKEDNALIKKEIENIRKILPIAELKLPENLINLRKEREDIKLLLDSLEEQLTRGKISKEEYESIKNANMKKLEEIRTNIESEWKKIEKFIKPIEKEEVTEVEPKIEEIKEKAKEKKPEKKIEEAPEKIEGEEEKPQKQEILKETEKTPKEIDEELAWKDYLKEKKAKGKVIEKKEEIKHKPKIKKSKPQKVVKPKTAKPKKAKKLVKSESQRKAEILKGLKRLS